MLSINDTLMFTKFTWYNIYVDDTSQIAFLRWSNVGSTLYTTMAHGRHTTLDQCSFDCWRMVG